MIPRRYRFLLVAGVAACLGCSAPRPLWTWQQRLTDYIAFHGYGDPSILRDAPALRSSRALRPAEIRFDVTDLRGPGPPLFRSTLDVNAVLVGQGQSSGARVFVFLVGINERIVGGTWQVGDIRAVAMTPRGSKLVWRSTQADSAALRRYLAGRSAPGNARLPAHKEHESFPALDDAFTLELQDAAAVVRDVHSAAVWRVELRASPPGTEGPRMRSPPPGGRPARTR